MKIRARLIRIRDAARSLLSGRDSSPQGSGHGG